MTDKFELKQWELTDVLLGRIKCLGIIDWDSDSEVQKTLDGIDEALNEYKRILRKYQKEHPTKRKP